VRRGHERLLRGRRPNDRLIADVRLLATGHWLRPEQAPEATALFSADKVWISSGDRGPGQIEESRRFWGVRRFDLLQVHDLLAWEEHLPALLAMKAAGRVRYVGITTSEGRRHAELEKIMASQPLDFVQITYNVLDREVEARILPLARDRGIAVIANRPFQEGALIRSVERHPLPSWAGEIGADSWARSSSSSSSPTPPSPAPFRPLPRWRT
jgi:diketogulonate reductase-like aldo/keto reductase